MRLYKEFGIDPKTGNAGLSEANPFDMVGKSADEFNRTVPLGAWYKFRDPKDGKIYTKERKRPPPDLSPAPQREMPAQPTRQTAAAETDLEDDET